MPPALLGAEFGVAGALNRNADEIQTLEELLTAKLAERATLLRTQDVLQAAG